MFSLWLYLWWFNRRTYYYIVLYLVLMPGYDMSLALKSVRIHRWWDFWPRIAISMDVMCASKQVILACPLGARIVVGVWCFWMENHKPWENHGKPWENHGKPWENHGKTMGKCLIYLLEWELQALAIEDMEVFSWDIVSGVKRGKLVNPRRWKKRGFQSENHCNKLWIFQQAIFDDGIRSWLLEVESWSSSWYRSILERQR